MKKFLCCLMVLSLAILTSCKGGVTISYKDSDKYTKGNTEIDGVVEVLDIDYYAGVIDIKYNEDEKIKVVEENNESFEDNLIVRSYLENKTLHVKFGAPGSYNITQPINKHLTVLVPKNQVLNKLDAEFVSATFNCNVVCKSYDIECVSSQVAITSTEVQEFDFEGVSSNVLLTATVVNEVDVETVSGSFALVCDSFRKIDMDTTSGAATISYSNMTDCNVSFNTISGKKTVDLEVSSTSSAKIVFNSISGDLTVSKRG